MFGDLEVGEVAFEERSHQGTQPRVCERVLVLDCGRFHQMAGGVDLGRCACDNQPPQRLVLLPCLGGR